MASVSPTMTRGETEAATSGRCPSIGVTRSIPKPVSRNCFRTPELERLPAFSPDGNWVAYAAGERVTPDIYVRPFPANPSGGKWKISSDGGTAPVWSPNGHELFFQKITREALGLGGGIMIVNYTTKD